MRTPSNEEIAWAAGLFEGEGALMVVPRKDRPPNQFLTRAMLGSTDLDVLERFAEIVGVGKIGSETQKYNPLTGAPYKPIWYWSVSNASDLIVLINMLKPWFGKRRGAKAELVLEQAWKIVARNVLTKAKFKDDQPALVYAVPRKTMDMLGRCLGEAPR